MEWEDVIVWKISIGECVISKGKTNNILPRFFCDWYHAPLHTTWKWPDFFSSLRLKIWHKKWTNLQGRHTAGGGGYLQWRHQGGGALGCICQKKEWSKSVILGKLSDFCPLINAFPPRYPSQKSSGAAGLVPDLGLVWSEVYRCWRLRTHTHFKAGCFAETLRYLNLYLKRTSERARARSIPQGCCPGCCLYHAMGGGCNLARFGSPEPRLHICKQHPGP